VADQFSAAEDWLNELATRPGGKTPATLGEIASSSWEAAGLHTPFGPEAPINEAYGELTSALRSETGMSDQEFTGDWGGEGLMPVSAIDRAAMIADRLDSLDKEGRDRLSGLIDVRKRASEKAAAIEAKAADVGSRTFGLTGTATSFLTGFARQVVDPANLATAWAGGPLKGPVLGMIGREFLIGAGVTAATEPLVAAQRKALGLEPDNFLGAVVEGGLGAAAASLVFRGAGAVLRLMRGTRTSSARAWISPAISARPRSSGRASATSRSRAWGSPAR